jgi:hypothetical protein
MVRQRPARPPPSALAFLPVELAVGPVQVAAQITSLLVGQALPVITLGRRALVAPLWRILGRRPLRIAPILLLQARPDVPRRGDRRLGRQRDT